MTRRSLGDRLYARLLHLYPREFREEYGAEMTRVYRDRAEGERVWRLWPTLLIDICHTAPREQLTVLTQDIRHTWRSFARTPLVTAAAILTIALGVGGSTAVFSMVYAIVLRPLPYPAPHRLVEVFEDHRESNLRMMRASALNYRSWAERNSSFDALAAFQGGSATITEPGDPERLAASFITASMFDVLALPLIEGRGFRAEDEVPGAAPVVVLAEGFWRRRFGADTRIVGQSVTLNGERYQVVGVAPHAFREIGRAQATAVGVTQVFLPLVVDPAKENRGNHTSRVVGRMRQGISIEQARDDMRRVAAVLARDFPESNKGWSVQVVSVYDSMLEPHVRPSLWALMAAVLMVLLIGCANVGSMLLARGVGRQREFALRGALGAGRSRIVRQLVTENVVLALVSGVCGLLLAVLAVQRLEALMPPTLPRLDAIGIDAAVFGMGLVLSLASGLVMGLVPALRASRLALLPSLAQHGKGTGSSAKPLVRHGIVAAQMTLATMLLVGAALLLQSLMRLQQVPLGFAADRVVTARISLPRDAYPDAERADAFWRQLLESLRDIPQVQAAGLGLSVPFSPGVRVSGRVADLSQVRQTPDAGVSAVQHIVSPAYFQTLGMPLVAGREFGPEDRTGAPAVAVVSEDVARRLWSNDNPIGKRLDWKGEQQAEVIGVVGDVRGARPRGVRGGTLDEDPASAVYFSSAQQPQHTMTVLVRTSGQFAEIGSSIGRVVRDIDSRQPVYQVRPLREWVDEALAQPRFTSSLIAGFAVIALLLAAVGVYGVLSYSVAQRTQEIGVRMAVGAERGQILMLVLRGSMGWALGGIAVGLMGALVLSRLLGPLLFAVAARDPLTYGVAGGVLAGVALLACWLPAVRATRVDPIIALRAE